MVDDAPEDPVFAVIPPADGWMFANDRLTPEQLASAVRVRDHGIDSENAVLREAELEADSAPTPSTDP